ncbi:PREDICTED: putative uncharacterized protein DDB_G0286901 isoform X2 [Vollenhovia emeryi]|uniref:putative uncharacterized protein DDB_G0286901 isoform X2 n=1 Tax=Vollenhovia emeryi TaxID=411798 RepID=UPI0005F434B9|nr:PREDICTED: putative uncharacterized protein DDB_G0286901 isoform X2 [Vollenhovia emeryi]
MVPSLYLYQSCENDQECPEKRYCYEVSNLCIEYTNCSLYYRKERDVPARLVENCGDCLSGFLTETLSDGSIRCNRDTDVNTDTNQNTNIIIGVSVSVIIIAIIIATILFTFIRKKSCTQCFRFFTQNARTQIQTYSVAKTSRDDTTNNNELNIASAPPEEQRSLIKVAEEKYHNINRRIINNEHQTATPFVPGQWEIDYYANNPLMSDHVIPHLDSNICNTSVFEDIPDIHIPEARVPETRVPGVRTPEARIPEARVSEVDIPDIGNIATQLQHKSPTTMQVIYNYFGYRPNATNEREDHIRNTTLLQTVSTDNGTNLSPRLNRTNNSDSTDSTDSTDNSTNSSPESNKRKNSDNGTNPSPKSNERKNSRKENSIFISQALNQNINLQADSTDNGTNSSPESNKGNNSDKKNNVIISQAVNHNINMHVIYP